MRATGISDITPRGGIDEGSENRDHNPIWYSMASFTLLNKEVTGWSVTVSMVRECDGDLRNA